VEERPAPAVFICDVLEFWIWSCAPCKRDPSERHQIWRRCRRRFMPLQCSTSLFILVPPHPSFVRMGNQASKKQQPSSAAAQAATVPLPNYTDYLTRRRHCWPRRADGRLLTCDETQTYIMRNCDFIAHVRAFGVRCLHQQLQLPPPPKPSPLCRLRAPYAAPAASDDASVRVYVSAAARVCLRCSEVARVAVGLATMAEADHQGAVQLCRWAACIIEYVCGCRCRQVEVWLRAAMQHNRV
jgi:hypothetical protein